MFDDGQWQKEKNWREERRQQFLRDVRIPDAVRIDFANSQQVIHRDMGGAIQQVGQILGPR